MLVETHVEHPIIDLSLFKIPTFATASVITVARSIGLFGSIFLIPLFVQQQMGYTAMQSGLLMLPPSLFMAVVFPLFGWVADKVGPKWPSIIGIIIVAYSLSMYGNISTDMTPMALMIPMMVRSVGMGLLMAPITTAVMNSVPQNKIGVASSMNNIIMQIGASIGIAIFVAILSNRTVYHISIVGQNAHSGNPIFMSVVEGLVQRAHGLGYSMSQAYAAAQGTVLKAMMKSAMINSFQDVFLLGSIIVALTVPLAFMLPAKVVTVPHGHKPGGQAASE
jgi:DHA2 family multidrug resistance protein